MTDSAFEAWLDEEWPDKDWIDDTQTQYYKGCKHGARAAWVKAKERSDKLVEALEDIREGSTHWSCARAEQALKAHGHKE